MNAYLSPAGFKVFAHRGSTEGGASENTLEAFRFAVDSGLKYIETDVQSTKDGVAVLFHDKSLKRVAGIDVKISDLLFTDLQKITLSTGGKVPSLIQALERFPDSRFNLDIKHSKAILRTVEAVKMTKSMDRVLVSSFSKTRRMQAVQLLQGVTTSADAPTALGIWLCYSLGLRALARKMLLKLQALQIPTNLGFLRLDTKSFISFVRATGVEIHYWTINSVVEAERLAKLGANGIVTDKGKMMFERFGHPNSK